MDLTLNRTVLLEELSLIQGVVERRTAMPILADVLLSAQGDRLTLAATDLDITLISSCPAAVRREGRATIRGKMFYDLVRALPSDSLDLSVTNERVELRSGSYESKLTSLRPEDFPTLPEIPQGQGFAIPQQLLHRLIDLTFFAVSPEEGQFQFNAALLNVTDREIDMVATDGHRLAFARDTHPGGTPPFNRQLLPRKVLAQLRRIPENDAEPLYLAQGENHLAFRFGERVLLSRMLEARFPQYERVLVRDNPHRAVAQRLDLLAALRRVGLLTSERTRGVHLAFQRDTISLTSVGFDLGQASEKLACQYSGPPLTIQVNAQFVIDFLAAVTTDQIQLQLRDEGGAVALVPFGSGGTVADALYIIMPIRV
ncbi:MAG: DNA polymerase III subunit beta [Acidobacteriota bacterium]|jgi:DNA polymerase-3 subunit beta